MVFKLGVCLHCAWLCLQDKMAWTYWHHLRYVLREGKTIECHLNYRSKLFELGKIECALRLVLFNVDELLFVVVFQLCFN